MVVYSVPGGNHDPLRSAGYTLSTKNPVTGSWDTGHLRPYFQACNSGAAETPAGRAIVALGIWLPTIIGQFSEWRADVTVAF
jgi:hypothetical protein